VQDNQIGIHIYRITVHRTRKPQKIQLSSGGEGANLFSATKYFIETFSQATEEGSQIARPWYFDQVIVDGRSWHGLIRYGSSGYESEIVDRRTRSLRFKREITDMDVIPLYFRIWVPDKGDYALIALQTFGLRSCVNRVREALEQYFRRSHDGFRLTYSPVVMTDLESIRSATVKSISFVKRDTASDRAVDQLGIPTTMVDYDLRITAKRRENLGRVGAIIERVKSLGKHETIDALGEEFDEAQAYVKVGNRRRKVTLFGVSKETGKVDLSEEVSRLPNGHPKFESIANEVRDLFIDIVQGG
jgi:hypothetical protein